ncbi:hypothetical protein Tcan_11304 [Toxocara canis]|uniref:EGF-like domain-containing protein n=1 Tax=Toxocara canis TaxID=6265 RepID=A0A0B2VVU4_TOXCA|nr:hypothetical protein Tcan_11304 [Toxocara canis]
MNSCSEHGICVELVNHAKCACDEGWRGATCSLNISQIFDIVNNPNITGATLGGDYEAIDEAIKEAKKVVAAFGLVQVGLGVLTATALLSSIVMASLTSGSDDSDFDPQALFQSHRLRAVVLAAGGSFYARNPYRYNLDIYYGCRFYHWLINTAFSIGQCLLMAEAANVEKMFGSIQFNKWKRGQRSDEAALTYLIRLPPCYIAPFAFVTASIVTNWNCICRPSSCIGSFSDDTFPLQLALVALNGGLMLGSIALCESAYLTKKNCAEAEIRRCEYFLLNWPYDLCKMLSVEKNLPFVLIGSILHFGCWISVALATDKQDTPLAVVAMIFLLLYSAFIIAQLIATRPELFKYVTIFSMILLPKWMSPEFEFFDTLTRNEVLAKWKPKRYLKEKEEEQRAKENEDKQAAIKIQRDNEKLLQKYPNLPPLLLFNIPDKGPPQTFPSPFPLLPTEDGYIPEWNRMMMQRNWTENYMGYRRTGMNVDESIRATKSAFVDADDYIGNLTLGGLLTWNDWENRMRTTDIFSEDRLQKHKINNPFLSEPEPSSSTLVDTEVSALRVCIGETVHEQILKAPPIKLNMQVRKMTEKWEETLKERNAPFDALYWDDPIVIHLTESCDKEMVGAILNVQEAEIERPKYAQSKRPISLNPRKRPLDDFWLDPDMPGFVGPHDLSAFDNPVLDSNVRTRRFFNKILERQWKNAIDDDLEFQLALLHLRSKGYSLMNFFA